jgi:signal transduction histidine kinase
VTAIEQSGRPGAAASERVAAARSRAEERLRRQRDLLRPLGAVVIVAVIAGSASGHPAPALHGSGLGITLSLCVFTVAVAIAIRDGFVRRDVAAQAAVVASIGAAGIALTALQPRASTGLAGGAAVWIAVARLPLVPGVIIASATTVGLGVAGALSGVSAAGVLATMLLCALLGLIAHFIKQARDSQERTEILLAQLEDARDEQARTAALAERGRIASELHDVLAHSLSGAAIQLEGARKLAEREHAEPQVRDAIARAGGLVRDGLASAREAVGALRGDELPGVAQLPALIESYRRDLNVDATLAVEGAARTLAADVNVALYRAAQEALTNVARYAPGAVTTVILTYGTDQTSLRIENGRGQGAPLAGIGGGAGLAGMHERIARAGGTMDAGATPAGWCVQLSVPT